MAAKQHLLLALAWVAALSNQKCFNLKKQDCSQSCFFFFIFVLNNIMAKNMNMGWDYGDGALNDPDVCFKRKNRWLFKIENVSAWEGSPCLPPFKGGRPGLTFKEMDSQHLNETIYFPSKPDWKPINLSLYDIKKKSNPVMDWIKKSYEVKSTGSTWKPSASGFKMGTCFLELYDGSGSIIEKWILENVWPNSIDFGDLDMSTSDVVTVDLTLRYDRAYLES